MSRQIARRLVAVALLLGVAAEMLLYRSSDGISLDSIGVPIVIGLSLAAAWLARRPSGAIDRLDYWIAPTAFACAVGVALRADDWIVAADLGAALLLTIAAAVSFNGVALTRLTSTAAVGIGLRALVMVQIGATWIVRAALPRRGPAPAAIGRGVPIARGLLLAFPVVLVFGLLFGAADAVFGRLAVNVLTLSVDLGDIPARVVVALMFAWLAGGLVLVAADESGMVRPLQSLGAAARAPSLAWVGIGSVEATVIVSVVGLLFAVFVGLQVAYLFGGVDTLAAAGMTYADYARRGFLELVIASLLSVGLVAALDQTLVERSRWFTAAALGLLALTAAVLVSAAMRLRLYQEAYGWTELRFFVYASIAWLGLALAATAFLIARDRMGYLAHVLGAATVLVAVAANAIGPAAFVAGQNVDRALDSSLVPAGGRTGLDVEYAGDLSDDAIPVLIAALPRLPAAQRIPLEAALRARWDRLRSDSALSSPADWNLGRERAIDALRGAFGG